MCVEGRHVLHSALVKMLFLCHTIRAQRTQRPRVLHMLTRTPQAAWTPRLYFASSPTSLQGRSQSIGCVKVTIPIESNHSVTLCQTFCLEFIKKNTPQFHPPFILAELINASLFYNTISTRLFHLIRFRPFFRGSLSLTGLHAATRQIPLSESPPSCMWALCCSDPRPRATFSE